MKTTADKLLVGAGVGGVVAVIGIYRWITAASVSTDLGYGITLESGDPFPYRVLTIVGFMALAAFAAAWLNHRSKTEVRPDPNGPVVYVSNQAPPQAPAWQPPPFAPEPQPQPELTYTEPTYTEPTYTEPRPTPPPTDDPFSDLF